MNTSNSGVLFENLSSYFLTSHFRLDRNHRIDHLMKDEKNKTSWYSLRSSKAFVVHSGTSFTTAAQLGSHQPEGQCVFFNLQRKH